MQDMNQEAEEQLSKLKTQLELLNEDDFPGFRNVYINLRALIKCLQHHPLIREHFGDEQVFHASYEDPREFDPVQYRTDISFSLALCQHVLEKGGESPTV